MEHLSGRPPRDTGYAVALDGGGSIYTAGSSSSTWGSPKRLFKGTKDAFLAKLDHTGNLVWNTFLGGSSQTEAYGLAVDGNGNAYVTGVSDGAWGSPVRPFSGGLDAFVAKVNASGGLEWNTFLGGAGSDVAHGVALDGNGGIYVAGKSDAG